MTDMLERWHDPIFHNLYEQVPAALAARLMELAEETTSDETVVEALAEGRIPRASGNVPVFPQRIDGLPTSLTTYNERLRALLGVAAIAGTTDLANYEPPSDTKSHVGSVLAQAIHQGCSLTDVALAAGLTPEQVVAIGKRTTPAASWLKHL